MAESVSAYTGLNPQVIGIQEAAALSADAFMAGDLLKITVGEVMIATTTQNLGIAGADCAGVDGTVVPVTLIDPHEIYVMKYESATATAETLIGEKKVLNYTVTTPSGGGHYITTTAGNDVYIVGLHPDDGATTGGRLLVKFMTITGQYTHVLE